MKIEQEEDDLLDIKYESYMDGYEKGKQREREHILKKEIKFCDFILRQLKVNSDLKSILDLIDIIEMEREELKQQINSEDKRE